MILFSRRSLPCSFAVTALVFLTETAAHAQSDTTKSARWQRIYISQYTGITSLKSSDLRLLQPRLGTDVTYRDVNYEGRPGSGSPNYGVKIGYFLPKVPRLGFEFEYNHTKMYAKLRDSRRLTGTWQGQPVDAIEPLSNRIQRYQVSNGVNSLSLNVLYRFPLSMSEKYPDGRFQPYIGGGPQYTYLYSINTVNRLWVKEKYHPNGWGCQIIGGVRCLATPHIGVFAEGKYQQGKAVSLIADQGDAEGGRGITGIRIAHLVGGLFYQF